MSLHTSIGESGRLLSPLDPDPVTIINQESSFPVLLVCEHAGKTVPAPRQCNPYCDRMHAPKQN